MVPMFFGRAFAKKIEDHIEHEVQTFATAEDYLYAAENFPEDPKYISEKFNVAQGQFLHDLPRFQSKGYELLLPLFAQFANMHLGLMRDGVLFGSSWGWSQDVVDHMKTQLAESIQEYTSYTEDIYQKGLDDTKSNAPSNGHKTEPFNTVNRYVREMTLTVMDFKSMWKYFDPTKYPDPVKVYLDREIYSDAVGTADDSTFALPNTPPTKPITQISVWGWDRIDAIQVDYPDGGGPDGVTTTYRMGNQSGGSNAEPHGGGFDLKQKGQVTTVKVLSGSILNALWFQFEDGSWTHQLGGKYSGGSQSEFSYSSHLLSSIKVMGESRYYGSADCAVFGFKFATSLTPTAEVLRLMYITRVGDVSPAERARRLGARGEMVQNVERWSEQYHWAKQRELYWQRLEQRVKARAKS